MYEAIQRSRKRLMGSTPTSSSRSIWNRGSGDKKKVSDPSLLRKQQQPTGSPVPAQKAVPPPTVSVKRMERPKTIPTQPVIGWLIVGVAVLALVGLLIGGLFPNSADGTKPDLPGTVGDAGKMERPKPEGTETIVPKTEQGRTQSAATVVSTRSDESVGDHVIVIATYTRGEDLDPVRLHFEQNGVRTTIEKRGTYFYLETISRYSNPRKQGSDGWNAIERIKQIGAKYKAPKGFERFSNVPFQDAYGRKIKPE